MTTIIIKRIAIAITRAFNGFPRFFYYSYSDLRLIINENLPNLIENCLRIKERLKVKIESLSYPIIG